METIPMWIDGREHQPAGGEWFDSFDPFTGQPWARVARGGKEDVDAAVAAASRAFREGSWAQLTPTRRGALVHRLGQVIADHAERLAELEVRDNGKLWAEMFGQVTYVPDWYRYFGGLADKVEGTVLPIDKDGYFVYTTQVPVGVTAIVTPWNSPLLLLAWKLAPALAAGCTVVVKPSEFTSASTVELAKLFTEAGLPDGVLNVVTGLGAEVGSPLTEHPDVKRVSFTGSDATGKAINRAVAGDLKHVGLELGGKSPNIVFADADLDDAVNGVVSGIFAATGQTCIAGSRLLVEKPVHDEVVERVVALAKTAVMGNPRLETTQVGPITTQPQYAKVLDYIGIAKDEGARVALGGGPAATASGTAGSSSPPSSPACPTTCGSPRRRSSGRSWRSSRSRARTRPPPSPTTPATASARASGPATSAGPSGWPTASSPAPSGSTPTGPSASRRPSAASRTPASAARTASAPSRTTSRPRPSGSTPVRLWATRSSCVEYAVQPAPCFGSASRPHRGSSTA